MTSIYPLKKHVGFWTVLIALISIIPQPLQGNVDIQSFIPTIQVSNMREQNMNYLDYIFQLWDRLYDRDQDAKSVVELFFHNDYTQCINGIEMNRSEYIDHVIEQKKHLKSMKFECKNHLLQSNKLFIIYNAKGKNTTGDDIEAEVISYFEFKDSKTFKIHGQVHLLKGNPSDVDMHD